MGSALDGLTARAECGPGAEVLRATGLRLDPAYRDVAGDGAGLVEEERLAERTWGLLEAALDT